MKKKEKERKMASSFKSEAVKVRIILLSLKELAPLSSGFRAFSPRQSSVY
jgi:hypothetical protein